MNKHCVYIIFNKRCNKIYVGRSVNPENRFKGHMSKLRRGKHRNSRLQASFNRFKEGAFTYAVIASGLDLKQAITLEHKMILETKSYQYRYGYNISKSGENRLVSESGIYKEGVKGYHYNKQLNKFRAQIQYNNRLYHLGLFKTPKEAHYAYLQAKRNFLMNNHRG